MTSDELNRALAALDDNTAIAPPALDGTGKALPYYGWFWRNVDWDSPITFAHAGGDWPHSSPRPIDDVPRWVGFCENNKWGYPMFTATPGQSAEVRRLAERLAADPTALHAADLYNYIQTLRPQGG